MKYINWGIYIYVSEGCSLIHNSSKVFIASLSLKTRFRRIYLANSTVLKGFFGFTGWQCWAFYWGYSSGIVAIPAFLSCGNTWSYMRVFSWSAWRWNFLSACWRRGAAFWTQRQERRCSTSFISDCVSILYLLLIHVTILIEVTSGKE